MIFGRVLALRFLRTPGAAVPSFRVPPVVRSLVVVAAILTATPSPAQTLEIAPRGTYFEILGPMSVRGRDVVDVSVLPDGHYRVRAEGMGLATMRRRFEIDRGGIRPLSWSGPTSVLMPPGLDHLQNGEARGWFHLFAGAIGGAFLYSAVDTYGEAPEGTPAEFDARNIRNLWTAYLSTIWLGASIESWLLTPEGSTRRTSEGLTLGVPRADRWNPTFRSVLVPGAGQRYLGRDRRANLFTGLFAVSAAAAIQTQDMYLEARRDNADDEDTKSTIRWIAVGATAYVYLWNVFDAFSLGRQAERSPGPQLVATPTHDGVALALNWSFR